MEWKESILQDELQATEGYDEDYGRIINNDKIRVKKQRYKQGMSCDWVSYTPTLSSIIDETIGENKAWVICIAISVSEIQRI